MIHRGHDKQQRYRVVCVEDSQGCALVFAPDGAPVTTVVVARTSSIVVLLGVRKRSVLVNPRRKTDERGCLCLCFL